jgi:cholesterol transport system auxiliary component
MRISLFIAAAAALAGCVSVLPKAPPPAARYQVTDVSDAIAAASVDWSLAIEEPDATLAVNTAKIALSREPARLEYYAGGQWVDRAPRLFGAALVRSFENSGAVKAVGSRLTLAVSDFALQTDLRQLAIVQTGEGLTAEAVVFARLTDGRSAIHASKLFRASTPVAADNAGAAARALNDGLTALQRDLVAWTIAEAEAAHAARRGGATASQ